MSDVFKTQKGVRIYTPRFNGNGGYIRFFSAADGKKKIHRGLTLPKSVFEKLPWIAGDYLIVDVYEDLNTFVLRLPKDGETGDFELQEHSRNAYRISSTSLSDAIQTYSMNWGYKNVERFTHWIINDGIAFKPISSNKRYKEAE